jgi:MFS family permease
MSTLAPSTGLRPGWALTLLALAQLIYALDLNIVFVALPEIGSALGFPGQTQQLIVSAYVVFAGGFLLFGGRAADLLGRRRMFLLALGLYGISSLAGGLAGDPVAIIVARAVQGIGGALLLPSTLSLINTLFEEGSKRNRALAVWGGAGASGLTIGALLGGVLTESFGWPAVFFVNVPLTAVVALGTLVRHRWIHAAGLRAGRRTRNGVGWRRRRRCTCTVGPAADAVRSGGISQC